MDKNLVKKFGFWYFVIVKKLIHIQLIWLFRDIFMIYWHKSSYIDIWSHSVALWTHMLTFKIIFCSISHLSKYETILNGMKPYVDIENYIAQYEPYVEYMKLLCALYTAQKMKFSIKDSFSKCDQICNFLRISSHLLKKSLMENFIFCEVFIDIWFYNAQYSFMCGSVVS